MTVRVPSEKLEVVLNGAADLGYFTANSTLHIDDRSLAFLENGLKQKNRTGSISSQKTIAFKDEMVDRFIQNKTIDADVAYSTVSLRLFQNAIVHKEVIANYVVADYTLPFSQRLGNNLSKGWDYFLGLLLALANLWAFLLSGVAVYIIYRRLQKRKIIISSTS